MGITHYNHKWNFKLLQKNICKTFVNLWCTTSPKFFPYKTYECNVFRKLICFLCTSDPKHVEPSNGAWTTFVQYTLEAPHSFLTLSLFILIVPL
jgi:hypothetical protein